MAQNNWPYSNPDGSFAKFGDRYQYLAAAAQRYSQNPVSQSDDANKSSAAQSSAQNQPPQSDSTSQSTTGQDFSQNQPFQTEDMNQGAATQSDSQGQSQGQSQLSTAGHRSQGLASQGFNQSGTQGSYYYGNRGQPWVEQYWTTKSQGWPRQQRNTYNEEYNTPQQMEQWNIQEDNYYNQQSYSENQGWEEEQGPAYDEEYKEQMQNWYNQENNSQQQSQRGNSSAGSNSTKQMGGKDSKKSNPGEEYWNKCSLCDLYFTSENSYVMHTKGLLHNSRVPASNKDKKKEGDDKAKKPADSVDEDDDDDDEDEDLSKCKVCDVEFKSTSSYYMHIRGISHHSKVAEAAERKRLGLSVEGEKKTKQEKPVVKKAEVKPVSKQSSEQLSQSPNIVSSGSGGGQKGTQAEAVEKEGGNKNEDEYENWNFCKVCQLPFKNPQAFLLHTRGILHVTKVEQAAKKGQPDEQTEQSKLLKQTKTIKPPTPREIISNEFFHCDVCDVSFNVKKAMDNHLKGPYHKKQLLISQGLDPNEENQCEVEEAEPPLKKPREDTTVNKSQDGEMETEPKIGAFHSETSAEKLEEDTTDNKSQFDEVEVDPLLGTYHCKEI